MSVRGSEALKLLVIQPSCDKMGHYGIYTTRLCQNLARRGHEVVLCTNKVRPERYLQEPAAFRTLEVGNGRWRFERADGGSYGAAYWWAYYRNSVLIVAAGLALARREPFDGIFITDAEFLSAALVLRLLGRCVAPVVMQVNAANFTYGDYRGSPLSKAYKVIQRAIFKTTLGRQIRAISVLGEWHRERLTEQLGLDSRCPAVLTGDGGSEPGNRLSRADARTQLGIRYEGPLLLFFGMLRRDKGIETLLEAVKVASRKEFRLLVAGHPTEYSEREIHQRIEALGIGEKVIARLGYVPEEQVGACFFASDALVLPYARIYRDGSGPLMKGACTYGLPVLASDICEMGRLVRLHGLGLVSEPDDPQSLANRIVEFLELPANARSVMGEAAAALARANSWEALAGKFSALFYDMKRTAAGPREKS